MYKGQRIILIAPAYNEESKIVEVIRRVPPGIVDKILIVDDGSTDNTASASLQAGADQVISLGKVMGVGAAIRCGYKLARQEGYEIAVTIAGNNKDDPSEIIKLLDPICDQQMDFVMGSRFMREGGYGGDMPLYRKIATRVHPWLLGTICGKKITESTNGYRAIKLSILDDNNIRLEQSWLDHYELEVYLLMKLLKSNYNTIEVPVHKIYPPKRIGNTKMRPIVDWWKILRPIFLIGLGFRS